MGAIIGHTWTLETGVSLLADADSSRPGDQSLITYELGIPTETYISSLKINCSDAFERGVYDSQHPSHWNFSTDSQGYLFTAERGWNVTGNKEFALLADHHALDTIGSLEITTSTSSQPQNLFDNLWIPAKIPEPSSLALLATIATAYLFRRKR